MTILKLHDEANVLFSDRNPFADPQALTLTDLIERIDRLPGCSPRERREISSALRTLARWFRLPPEAVPANLQFIR